MPLPSSFLWAFLSAGLAAGVILMALAAALVINQRRFLALHRAHAEGVLRAQEEERAWVARELHDDALQRIALLLHELAAWEDATPEKSTQALRAELLDLTEMLRHIAHHLHPAVVDRGGLVPALEQLVADLSDASRLPLALRAADEERVATLDAEQALVAYRVAQEALSNLIKHSGAERGSVEVRAENGGVVLEVTDHGRGFAVHHASRIGHLGLISMSERARAVDGLLEIRSEPGAGTVVHLQIPWRST